MRWIALAIAVYAIIEWVSAYAMYYEWNLPIWLGHIAYGIMFLAAVGGIINYRRNHRTVHGNQDS